MSEKTSKKLATVDDLINEVGSCGLFHLKQIFKMLIVATMSAITIYVTIFNIADQKLLCFDKNLNQTVDSNEKVEKRAYT